MFQQVTLFAQHILSLVCVSAAFRHLLITFSFQIYSTTWFVKPEILCPFLERSLVKYCKRMRVSGSCIMHINLPCFLHSIHDRKMSVLGFCSLLQCPVRPAPVLSLASKVVPAIISQLESLVEAYKCEPKLQ